MRRLLHIPILVVTFALLAPVVMCVAPETGIATSEPECCKHMSAACGDSSRMAECCIVTVTDVAVSAPAKTPIKFVQVPNAIIAWAEMSPDARFPDNLARSWIDSSSPPASFPGLLTVLRI